MRSSIAKLTNATSEHNKKLKAEYDAKMKAYQDSLTSYENELKIHEIVTNPKYHADDAKPNYHQTENYTKENLEKRDEARKLYSENRKRGIVFPDDRNYPISTETMGVEDGDTTWLGHIHGPEENPKLPTKQEITDVMKPTKPEEPNYREISKPIEIKALKNIFMPVAGGPELTKALPIGIRNDRYYTLSGVPNQGGGTVPGKHGNRLVLSDQSGKEIERFKNIEEYQEKYGDALQRGTKQYGQENLKRRLYPKGYTKK